MMRTLQNLFHIHVIVGLIDNEIGDLGREQSQFYFIIIFSLSHLQVPVDQIIHFKVFVIVPKWIEKGFCHLIHQVSLLEQCKHVKKGGNHTLIQPR